MIKVLAIAEFCFGDYFNRAGFGDGDDRVALDFGYGYRDTAIEIFNEELKKAGLEKWEARECDARTIHNPCTIDIFYDGQIVSVDCPYSEEFSIDAEASPTELLAEEVLRVENEVWPAAYELFAITVQTTERDSEDPLLKEVYKAAGNLLLETNTEEPVKKDPFRPADFWLDCPACEDAFGWNEEDGLVGQSCSCGYEFTDDDQKMSQRQEKA